MPSKNQDVRTFNPFVTKFNKDVKTSSCSGYGEEKIRDQRLDLYQCLISSVFVIIKYMSSFQKGKLIANAH